MAATTTTSKTTVADNERWSWWSPSDVFDIADQDDENEEKMGARRRGTKIAEDFNIAYNFDDTRYLLCDEEDSPFLERSNSVDSDDSSQMGDEQVLSQRLSQLSTNSDNYEHQPSPTDGKRRRLSLTTTTMKRLRTDVADTHDEDEAVPKYLSAENQSFQQMIAKVTDRVSPLQVDQLRQTAVFLHQMNGYTVLQQLWSAYQRSGTGLIVTALDMSDCEKSMPDVDRRYWPKQVRALMDAQRQTVDEDEQATCEKIAAQRLREYEKKIEHYRVQFDTMKRQLAYCWTTTLEEAMEKFVHVHAMASLRMRVDSKIAIVTFECTDQILQRVYQHQHPTDYQKRIAQRLYEFEWRLERARCELFVHRQRVICNQPLACFDALEMRQPLCTSSMIRQLRRPEFVDRYERLIEQSKTDLMAVHIAGLHAEIDQYQTQFNEETKQMWKNHRDHVADKEMTNALTGLLEQRSKNMRRQIEELGQFIVRYHLRSPYGYMESVKQGKAQPGRRIGFLPSLLIDPAAAATSTQPLNNQQLQLLRRGPTYVAPGQLHLSSLCPTTDEMLVKQCAPLKRQLAVVFDKYHVDISRSINAQKHTYEAFKEIYAHSLPDDIYQRAVYERRLVRSIRSALTTNNLILRRTANHRNVFYLGQNDDFTRLCSQYMTSADHYRVLIDCQHGSNTPGVMNVEEVQQQLKQKFQLINTQLEKLCQQKRLYSVLLKQLRVKIERLQLPYLYFLPEVTSSKPTAAAVQVKPMIVAHRSATSKIAQYLKQLLRPLISRQMLRSTFVNEADLIERLTDYTDKERHLHPTTLFATIKITNFHALTTHTSMTNALVNFLTDQLPTNKLYYQSILTKQRQSISIDTIGQLTALYLENNIFYYDGKVYEFLKGSPDSILLSELLSTIYVFAYERIICDDPRLKPELYGRCKDHIFFTWNRSNEELATFLQTTADKHREVRLETTVGQSIPFLNAYIANRNGHLYTRVYHGPGQLNYSLPYVVGHARLQHSHWLRSALVHAVRLCSSYVDFHQEQTYLEMTCLANGYSIDFVERQLKNFYVRFGADNIRFCLDQSVYERLRRRLFDFMSVQRTRAEQDQEREDQEYVFRFSYPYDYGAYNQFEQKFQQIWSVYLRDDSQLAHQNAKVILETKHIYSLNSLLAHGKPRGSPAADELFKTDTKSTF